MKTLRLISVGLMAVLMCVNFTSCNGDDEDISDIDLAPSEVIGKEFKFYKNENDKFSFKALMGEKSGDALILTSSEVAKTEECNAWYNKTGAQTGNFECFFTTMILLGQQGIYQWNQYKFDLNFISKNHGYFTGIMMKNPMDKVGEEISGRFIFNSDKEPSAFNWDTTNDKINYEYLVGKTWFNENYDCLRYIKFKDDNTFRQFISFDDEVEMSEGNYEINKKSNIITLKSYNNNVYERFKVCKLSKNEMKVLLPDVNGAYLEELSLEYEKIDDEDVPPFVNAEEKLEISEPIVENITDISAQVKGTILGQNLTFIGRGVQYSTDPDMANNVVTVKHNSDVINVTLNNLYEGTTYYVRLFAQTDNKIYYSNIKSFTTTGTKVYNIQMEQKGIFNNHIIIDAKLPNDVEEYGICYGRSPNPKITDSYMKEQKRCERWILSGLESATTYYIRPYHIEGTNVIYYDESEVSFETLGKSVKFDCKFNLAGLQYDEPGWDAIIYDAGIFVNWENFNPGTYLLKCSVWAGQSRTYHFEEYMDSEKSSMYLPVNDNLYIGLMTNIRMLFLDAHVTDLNGNLITILCLQYQFDIEKETYSIKNRTDTESDNIYEYLNEGKI